MKKIKIALIVLILMLINNVSVLAECSSEEVQVLKEKASNIEIKLELKENVEGEYGSSFKYHDLIISNLTEEFFIIDGYYNETYGIRNVNNEGNIVLYNYAPGTQSFKIYSQKCGSLISSINIEVPRYNWFSQDPLCDGISGEELDVCGEWYSKKIEYDTFKNKVEAYNEQKKTNENLSDFSLSNYWWIKYLIIAILVLLVILLIVKKKRKRSELL